MPNKDEPAINPPARRADGGFTLIELVVVTVILAVLAAFAVPRFLDMSSTARIAAVKAAAGAIFTGATQANTKCLLTPTCDRDSCSYESNVVGPDGTSNGLCYGYPTGRVPAVFYWGINDWVVLQGFTAIQAAPSITDFTKDGAPDPSNCKIRYLEAAGHNFLPTVVQTTTGC